MTWKNYSTEHCGQTVTDLMMRFAVFGRMHQGQANGWSIVGHHHHMENQGSRPEKNYSTELCDQTVTDVMIRFLVFGSLHQCLCWLLPSHGKPMTKTLIWNSWIMTPCPK